MTVNPFEIREELEKLERKHAENPEGRYFVPLANAYRKAGKMDRAIQVLREGLETHSDYVSAHIVLGRCLAESGDVAAAESEFRRVLALDPQNLIALRTIGEISLESGRVEEAQRWYRELLKVDPMNEEARRALDGMQVLPAPPAPAEPPSKPITTAANFDVLFGGGRDARDASDDEDVPFALEDQSVVTETIAELYTRQGFYARAADVYRELIRRRGASAELEERLRRVESLAAGEVEQDVGASRPVPVSTPVATQAIDDSVIDDSMVEAEIASPETDSFAESFIDGFIRLDDEEPAGQRAPDGSTEAVPAIEAPSAPPEESPTVTGGETIREYLAGVLSWRPDEPKRETAAAISEASEPDEVMAVYEPTSGLMQGYDEELFPWELPGEPSAGSGGEPKDEDVDVAFAEEASPASSTSAASPPAAPAGPVPLDEPVPAAPPASEEASSPAAASTEDEDLESFQTWLRSLKR